MKCKHSGLCTWTTARVFVDTIDGLKAPSEVIGPLRCDRCGETLGLGESYDIGVEHEIRAAEIAADHGLYAGPKLFGVDQSSWFGWCQHYAAEHDNRAAAHDHELAGYLARCIATHKDLP